MREAVMHYIWANRLYNKVTIGGQEIEVRHPGHHNFGDGPDFLTSRLAWDGLEWCGAVELHVHSNEWEHHGHTSDPKYDGVILHVVMVAEDKVAYTAQGRLVPTATMEVQGDLLAKIEQLDLSTEALRCSPEIAEVHPDKIRAYFDQLLAEHIEQKLARMDHLAQEEMNYNATFYYSLLRYLGAYRNNEAMEMVAQSLPLSFLRKHRDDVVVLEAMLIGQAGLLYPVPRDDYEAKLLQDYKFYLTKFGLKPVINDPFSKLRVRPSSYPARMLAIAAMFISHEDEFMEAIATLDMKRLYKLTGMQPNKYWQTHNDFDAEISKTKGGKVRIYSALGAQTRRSLMINAIIPTAYHYHRTLGNKAKCECAVEHLFEMKAEQNYITRIFDNAGITPRNAGESQAMIYLYRNLCSERKCLQCRMSGEILKKLKENED